MARKPRKIGIVCEERSRSEQYFLGLKTQIRMNGDTVEFLDQIDEDPQVDALIVYLLNPEQNSELSDFVARCICELNMPVFDVSPRPVYPHDHAQYKKVPDEEQTTSRLAALLAREVKIR